MVELNIIIFITVLSLIFLLIMRVMNGETDENPDHERRGRDRRFMQRRSVDRRDDYQHFHLFDRRTAEPVLERRTYDRRLMERRSMNRMVQCL
ncbi:MAG: hypothetical protein CVV44_02475 [Spirochaetae bacterium HGW-Spirochaetae-1]|nr:MAG: hypothetical protein CVV44_02475 [Spirochaetae bacterium HGW-Spirochaetae-1]